MSEQDTLMLQQGPDPPTIPMSARIQQWHLAWRPDSMWSNSLVHPAAYARRATLRGGDFGGCVGSRTSPRPVNGHDAQKVKEWSVGGEAQ
eukprot:1540126-Pleurochrysis_carterae.AAC.1